jgi:hypothetical protein
MKQLGDKFNAPVKVQSGQGFVKVALEKWVKTGNTLDIRAIPC